MMTQVYGFERYERARRYYEDTQYLEAARELEELFTEIAAARGAESPVTGEGSPEDVSHGSPAQAGQGASGAAAGGPDAASDPVGHGLAEVRLLLARSYFRSAQLTRAEGAARQVIAEDPQDAYAHLLLGRTLQRAGRSDEAAGPLRLAQLLGGYDTGSGGSAMDVDDAPF